MSRACTAVMRSRFSVSARWACSRASCAWSWAYWRALVVDIPEYIPPDAIVDDEDDGAPEVIAVDAAVEVDVEVVVGRMDARGREDDWEWE